jgi:cell division septum initiation protein DivIVA
VVVVSDSGMKGRVRGLLGTPQEGEPSPPMGAPPQTSAQHEALQVLTLAQRTAEEHLNSARRETDRIYGEARERAGQIVREAQGRAEALQRDADAALSEAHAAAAQIASDARARADEAQQEAEEILSDARLRADELEKLAQAKADELQHMAEQRYEDVVGNLAAKREALQQQIEALERFDREYRARLQAFMQGQLRALWVDEPKVDADDLEPADGGTQPATRSEPHRPGVADEMA